MENTPKPTQCNLTHHLDNCEYICQICKKLLCSSCVDEDTCLPGKYHTFQILNLLLKDKSKIYLYDSTSGIISFLLADLKNIKDFETITMDISKDSTVRKFEVYKLENSYFRICVDPNELVERGVLYMVECKP